MGNLGSDTPPPPFLGSFLSFFFFLMICSPMRDVWTIINDNERCVEICQISIFPLSMIMSLWEHIKVDNELQGQMIKL